MSKYIILIIAMFSAFPLAAQTKKVTIKNALEKCVKFELDDYRTEDNLILSNTNIMLLKDINACGCKTIYGRYSVEIENKRKSKSKSRRGTNNILYIGQLTLLRPETKDLVLSTQPDKVGDNALIIRFFCADSD